MRKIITVTALAAALAVSGSAVAGASATAPHRVTVHSLEGAIVHGQTITIDGRTYAARQVGGPAHVAVSCAAQLRAYRLVSRQADLRIGSTLPGHHSGGGPVVWAADLQRVNPPLAATFRGIYSDPGMRLAVLALTASAAAAMEGSNCSR